MPLEDVRRLTTPPVVGRNYLVPTIVYPWLGLKAKPLPVLGTRHEDEEHLNFPFQHYHVDGRFLSPRDFNHAAGARVYDEANVLDPWSTLQGAVLHHRDFPEHPPIVMRRRQCKRRQGPYRHHGHHRIDALADAYAGQQCAASKAGWVCPHKNYPLGSVPTVDGVITCPLHGLRIKADDGRVLARGECAKQMSLPLGND